MLTGRRRFLRNSSRVTAGLALIGFLAGTIGIPVLVPSHGGGLRPYPCLGHRCGCTTPEQCWNFCCCFTHQQKLAWARRHGIEPPPEVERLARKEAELQKKTGLRSSGCACCRTAATSLPSSDCQAPDHGCPRPGASQAATASAHAAWSVSWICAIAARRCQGQAEQWMVLGAVAPPPPVFMATLYLACNRLVSLPLSSLRGVSFSPAPPPPRA